MIWQVLETKLCHPFGVSLIVRAYCRKLECILVWNMDKYREDVDISVFRYCLDTVKVLTLQSDWHRFL